MIKAKTGDQSADEGDHGSNNARWKPHFRLADAVVAFGVVVSDSISCWAAQVGADQRADEGREKDEALLGGGKKIRSAHAHESVFSRFLGRMT